MNRLFLFVPLTSQRSFNVRFEIVHLVGEHDEQKDVGAENILVLLVPPAPTGRPIAHFTSYSMRR